MIFSSEQPQTGMNEGTWFTQGLCIKNEGYSCGRGDVWGRVKKKREICGDFPLLICCKRRCTMRTGSV